MPITMKNKPKNRGKNVIKKIVASLLLSAMLFGNTITAINATTVNVYADEFVCVYKHDPRLNERAMEDIIVNPKAVYGFSPNPESSRLGTYAEYDWTDPVVVEDARQQRIAYHNDFVKLYELRDKLTNEGKSIEEVARAVSELRNQIRLDAYKDDPEGLKKVKESNLSKYGNENGPTVESLFEKYGSWEMVLQKSFSENAGMDACCGLYDIYYENYKVAGAIKETVPVSAATQAEATPAATVTQTEATPVTAVSNTENVPTATVIQTVPFVYTVVKGDTLYHIAKTYYGDGSKYALIAANNGITNPNLIFVGQQISISY